MFNVRYIYYISNKGVPQECDKEENVELMGLLILHA
jgi:hypothetical protein